ncbi:uncharacterized protein LOC109860380 isoform X1 [Pseudomyrmex gracilis]|uniref:uncharacterized protein LOC109860380 isoform X1 n=1 Tax=Pseudomyrmex gracilis TaxID=219809 RepID=UPI000994BB5C|nr:uncharacterized protein LOC109860380 isoform X1 [Pseudomyrmex gracilis]
MPYYNDIPHYYGGGAYVNHSSLMTGMGRTPFHLPLSRFSPHLSTISESPLNHLHRFSPISVRPHTRRVIDTADIDVSSPRIVSHDGNRTRNRLRRNRPTIKIRSQALKNNPALREHNEKHEKSVGELLMEKFYIKDKKSDGNQQTTHLYHQVSLDEKNDAAREVLQRRITRRFTRRRSSADLQLDAEQLQQEATYAQVQAKVLDSLVAEEQAQIENEVRRGTLIRKGATRGLSEGASRSYANSTDDSMTQEEEEEKEEEEKEEVVEAKIKKTTKKTKKKKKPTVISDKPSPDDMLESSAREVFNDSKNKEESNDSRSQIYKIEDCNSAGDFTAIELNATSEKDEKKHKSTLEQYRESVRVPIPKKSGITRNAVAKSTDVIETQVILPVRKPYVKDPSRNSVHLTVRKPTEELSEKLEQLNENLDAEDVQNEADLATNFVDDSNKILRDKVCEKNLSELTTDEDNKNVSLIKTAVKTNKGISETKNKTQKIVQDALSEKITNSVDSSVLALKTEFKENLQSDQLDSSGDLIANKNKNEEHKNSIDNTKKNVEAANKTPGYLATKDFITSGKDSVEASRTDKLAEKDRIPDATRSVVSIEADEKSANSNVTLTPSSVIGCLPKLSKINTDRNNAVEAPELPLQETAEYLAKSAEDVVKVSAAAALPKKKVNKASNLAKISPFNALKKTSGVNAATFEIDAARCDAAAKSKIQDTTLLKETNDQVRSNDRNEKTKSTTTTIKLTKDIDLTSRNDVGKTTENVPRQLSLDTTGSSKTEVIDADVTVNSCDINIKKTSDIEKTLPTDSGLSNIKNKAAPKLDNINVKSLSKTTTFPKTVASPVEKDPGLCKTIKVNNTDLTLSSKNNLNVSKLPLKNSIGNSFDTKADPSLPKLISSNENASEISQQSADGKNTNKHSVPIENEAVTSSNNVTKTKKKPINVNCNKWQEKSAQLSKSSSTESIDFWSEIKAPSSPETTKPKYQNEMFSHETTVPPKRGFEEKTQQDLIKFSNDLMAKESSTVAKEDNKESETKISVAESGNSAFVRICDHAVQDQKEKEKVILEESCRIKKVETTKPSETITMKKDNTPTVRRMPSKKKKKKILSITIDNNDSTSSVKKAPLKRNDVTTPQQFNTNAISTVTPEVILPVINITEAPKTSEVSHNGDEDEYDDPSTPTNEVPPDSLLTTKMSRWSNQDNLTNTDDVATPIASEETSLTTSPNVSPHSSKIKRTIKKKKPSTKKKLSVKSGKEGINEESRNNESTTAKPAEKQLAKLSPQISPKSSPRNSPSQRPIDLIKMFYTTPSALLTATPRDLSKVRRAKIKRRRHHSRTPSVSSDSTGSTTSTATTESTDGRGSICNELDDDSEQKRMNSTRSNDSGFDGSPRISNCDMACHKKCEKLTGNLCGLNQKLVAEALQALKRGE